MDGQTSATNSTHEQEFYWCGAPDAGQDVSVRLVPSAPEETDIGRRQAVAVLKVHSHRLKTCSPYFEALFLRWSPSEELSLEISDGIPTSTYKDCFDRMYKPHRKGFEPDLESNLALLQVASQIEFTELLFSLCRYLSTILWTKDEESAIRRCFFAPNFPRFLARDLLARLGLTKEGKKLLLDQILESFRAAMSWRPKGLAGTKLTKARLVFEEVFPGFVGGEADSGFEKNVIKRVSNELRRRLRDFQKDCCQCVSHSNAVPLGNHPDRKVHVESVGGFRRKLMALCWGLDLVLQAQVADDVIPELLHLDQFPLIIAGAACCSDARFSGLGMKFAEVVIFVFREVVAGRLLLGIPDRVLLLKNWQLSELIFFWEKNYILQTCGFAKAKQDVFLTLSPVEQLNLLQQDSFNFSEFVSRDLLITLVKGMWTPKVASKQAGARNVAPAEVQTVPEQAAVQVFPEQAEVEARKTKKRRTDAGPSA